MSCWHWSVVLRIPASALGFGTLREWNEFVEEHEDSFQWDKGFFCDSLCEDYPLVFDWRRELTDDPDRQLDMRDPEHPDVVPGPFLDYYLLDDYPLPAECNTFGERNEARRLSRSETEEYLPLFRKLFPDFTQKDMETVRRCQFEYYDGGNAPYLYSTGWEDEPAWDDGEET